MSLRPELRLRQRSRLATAVTAAALASAALQGPALAGSTTSAPVACPWMNTRDTPEQRARLLLNASTLDQKLRWLDEQAANSPTQTTFSGVTYPVQVPCTPTVVYTDGPDYVRGSTGATVFPAQIALASAWSSDLAFAKGKAEADEAFKAGKNVILGPGVSSARTPLAGRTPEYLGEDSLLSGTLAGADIRGIQTGNPTEPVMAVLKHYIANEQELDRQTSSSDIDGRTLREVYNQPFAIAIAKGSPGGVMCSYNQVNGVYSCENPLLDNLLKAADGFTGYTVSDFGAVHSTGPSLTAGLDQELNRPVFSTPAGIGAAIDAGQVTAAQVDQAAFTVVTAYIRAGLFDHPLPATASTTPSSPASKAVSEQIAERGSVLLKNQDAALPLTAASRTIAVIGQTASNTPANGISAASVCAEHGVFGPSAACPDPVAPLDAMTARAARNGSTVRYDNGADPASAAAAAKSADVAVVFAYAFQGEGADRASLSLDGNGDALISAVAAANPHTIVVLETGTAVAMPWLDRVQGVIEAWYPGDQQGTALARLLFGDADFTGRLPITFPVSLADTPTRTPQQYPGTFADGSTTRAGQHRRPPGQLQRRARRRLQVVRQPRHRAALPVRLRPVLHHLRLQPPGRDGHRRSQGPHRLHGAQHRIGRRNRDAAGLPHPALSDRRARQAPGRLQPSHPRRGQVRTRRGHDRCQLPRPPAVVLEHDRPHMDDRARHLQPAGGFVRPQYPPDRLVPDRLAPTEIRTSHRAARRHGGTPHTVSNPPHADSRSASSAGSRTRSAAAAASWAVGTRVAPTTGITTGERPSSHARATRAAPTPRSDAIRPIQTARSGAAWASPRSGE